MPSSISLKGILIDVCTLFDSLRAQLFPAAGDAELRALEEFTYQPSPLKITKVGSPRRLN